LGMQLWLPTGKTGHSCEGISRGSRRQSQGRRPHRARGACACPSVWPGHGGASASNWEGHSLAKDKAAQCCGHRICPGDTSMTLATQSGDKGVARSKARALPQTPQKPLRASCPGSPPGPHSTIPCPQVLEEGCTGQRFSPTSRLSRQPAPRPCWAPLCR